MPWRNFTISSAKPSPFLEDLFITSDVEREQCERALSHCRAEELETDNGLLLERATYLLASVYFPSGRRVNMGF